MNNKAEELLFILALSAGFKTSKEEIVRAWNNGDIYIFDRQGIKEWYLDVIDNDPKQDWTRLLNEDITENFVIILDDNTYAMYI